MSAATTNQLIALINRGEDLQVARSMTALRPITANSIANRSFDAATIQRDAEQTRIVVHARYPELVQAFLAHKRAHGSAVEKALYGTPDAWTWRQQVARLVAKRPLAFLNGSDDTMLRDGQDIGGARGEWDRVGTDREGTNRNLKLAEYLSYDEIMLGSLLAVSSPSYFINAGDRDNGGVVGTPGSYEPRGVIIGLVGARFERADRMDSQYILPPVARPRQHPALNRLFRDFFSPSPSPGVRAGGRGSAFDVGMYKARIRPTVDVLLLEANHRAVDTGQCAYVFVVGLGLGVWQQNNNQPRYFIEVFAEALDEYGSSLDNIGTLEFSWITVPDATRRLVTAAATGRYGIDIIFSRRDPAAKLSAAKADQLLVLSYAWDGNSFPGNEYWMGSLDASNDPAAACMSTISELHNPVINPRFLERIHVVATDARDAYAD